MPRDLHDGDKDDLQALESLDVGAAAGVADLLRAMSKTAFGGRRLGEAFEVLSPGDEHRSGETLVRLPDPPRALAFLQERHIHVTEKPEGLRISTHFYNTEAEIDACVDALVEYRELLLL